MTVLYRHLHLDGLYQPLEQAVSLHIGSRHSAKHLITIYQGLPSLRFTRYSRDDSSDNVVMFEVAGLKARMQTTGVMNASD